MTATVQITYRQRCDHSQLRIDTTARNCSRSAGHHRDLPESGTSPQ